MLNVIPIPAFKDNYIWLLVNPNNQRCVIVDPGDAAPVISFLEKENLTPVAILITHHHHDHTGGINLLKQTYPLDVYGSKRENVAGVDHLLDENEVIDLTDLNLQLKVINIPGHTQGHIAYYGHGLLFCGDTLFAAGCGRLFEGTPEQMVQSLAKIAQLPDDTLIYCAHEYTEANLKFANTVETNNPDTQKRIHDVAKLRSKNYPTLPSTLKMEKLTNPFLRCEIDSVIKSAQLQSGELITDPVRVFQVIRQWKDTF